MRIEWDERKDRANRRMHRVSFAVAAEIFVDPLVATVVDAWHPAEETRFFSIGVARKGRLLSVGHSDDGTIVRIITARDSQRMSRFNRKKVKSDDMPDEIDFSNAVRGKYAERFALGSNIVMIRPEIFAAFPGEEAVNDALELLMLAGKQAVARAARRRPAPKAAQAVGSSR